MYRILKNIHTPQDVKKLNINELTELSNEVREALFNRLTKVGGHFGSNFGTVELEIAMHYVFDAPNDKFVFDVSHQSYTHKMLTGRVPGYIDDTHFKDDSGYTNPDESVYDLFNVGHTSTSISLATGLAKAQELKGLKNNIVALIGDGSLSGGEALEGLNVAGSEIHSNLIIIVNDNQQSISETHGGLYKSLQDLRKTGGTSANNFFKTIGLDYLYVDKGNDISSLINALQKVKDIDHPIVVHVNTLKGKGYELAEQNKEQWHWVMPFDRQTGKPKYSFDKETYTAIARQYILNKAQKDKDFVVVTPNMPGSMALSPIDRESLGKQFVDVGIAEEQAVAMSAGLAKLGAKPLVITNTTFMQRTYDQISHDVCINNSPVTILLNYTSFAGLTDVTHLGIFGLSIFTNIPNLAVLCPTCKQEFVEMLDYALDSRKHPTVILIPGNEVDYRECLHFDNAEKYSVDIKGKDVAILALGDFYQFGRKLADAITKQLGFTPTLINPRVASAIDKDLLNKLKDDHKLVITLEDGILDGGFGQKITAFYSASDVKVKIYGLNKQFYDRYSPQKLLEELGITEKQIINDIKLSAVLSESL